MVRVSETYDLSTKQNKMALIGVHTPDAGLVSRTYPGLCINSKFCRFVSQDVMIACASMQAADPLQVGTEAGTIAPEDLFNPILYKAVTNDAMSMIEARMHGLYLDENAGHVNGHQAEISNEDVTGLADDFAVYYSFLSNRDGFRTANPQQGLQMKGLRPMVFEMNYSRGDAGRPTGQQYADVLPAGEDIVDDTVNGGIKQIHDWGKAFRGGIKPMPRFPTTYITGVGKDGEVAGTNFQYNGMNEGTPIVNQIKMPELGSIYTACIIVPPSRLHKLYYRMVVTTLVEFSDIRPISDISSFNALALQYASNVYYRDYEVAASKMQLKASQVDVNDADMQKVM